MIGKLSDIMIHKQHFHVENYLQIIANIVKIEFGFVADGRKTFTVTKKHKVVPLQQKLSHVCNGITTISALYSCSTGQCDIWGHTFWDICPGMHLCIGTFNILLILENNNPCFTKAICRLQCSSSQNKPLIVLNDVYPKKTLSKYYGFRVITAWVCMWIGY